MWAGSRHDPGKKCEQIRGRRGPDLGGGPSVRTPALGMSGSCTHGCRPGEVGPGSSQGTQPDPAHEEGAGKKASHRTTSLPVPNAVLGALGSVHRGQLGDRVGRKCGPDVERQPEAAGTHVQLPLGRHAGPQHHRLCPEVSGGRRQGQEVTSIDRLCTCQEPCNAPLSDSPLCGLGGHPPSL